MSKYLVAYSAIPRKFESNANLDTSLPCDESDFIQTNLKDTFVRAMIPIMEVFLEYFLESEFMNGLSINQSALIMRKHIMMAVIFMFVLQRNTDNTVSSFTKLY